MPDPTVFISYRRSANSADAGRLFDALARSFNRASLFMDVDSLRPGQDWLETIEQAVGNSDAVLVLIGADWSQLRDADGRRRLDDPSDPVRLEIETALRLGKPIMPVLFDESRMPTRDELPEALRPLLRRHAIHIAHASFESDLAPLVKALAEIGARKAGSAEVSATTRGFLFADLRGYTDFVERKGDDEAAKLLDRYRRMVREVVARHQGAEVKTEGDSFYVLFPSASRAVSAALDIVAEADKRAAEDPSLPIKVGVGVHAGETAETDEGPVGSAVNLAARISAQAQAGEVLVSETVRGLTRTRQVAAFEPVGNRRLKGIAEPIPLFRALAPGTVLAGGGRGTPRTPLTSLRSGEGQWRWLVAGAAVVAVLLIGYFAWGAISGGSAAPTSSNPGVGGTSPTPGSTDGPTTQPTDPPTSQPTPTVEPTPTPFVPIGSRIIFSRQDRREGALCDLLPPDAKLFVLDPDDLEQDPYRLTPYSNLMELAPTWSADGSQIGFVASTNHRSPGIAAVSPAGQPVEALLGSGQAQGISPFTGTMLTMAPDGSAVVNADEEHAWRTDVGGTGPVQVVGQPPPTDPDGDPPPPTEFIVDIAYRADGRLLVLFGPVEGGTQWFETMADDGSGRERVDVDLDGLAVSGFALAPDDDLVALVTFDFETGETLDLLVGGLAEGREGLSAIPLEMESFGQPAFSPKGDRLVLEAGTADVRELYEVEIEGGEVRQLTDDAETMPCSPVWRDAPANLAPPWPEPAEGEPRRFELGRLIPGAYLNDTLQPPIALTFNDGWYSRRNYADGWSVYRPNGPAGEVDYGRVQFGPDNPCGEGDLLAIGNAPEALLSYLQARDDLSLTDVGPINLSGYPGITAKISGIVGQGCGAEDDPEFEFWDLFPTGEDSVGLGNDEGLRLVTLDVRGTARSFLVFATLDELDSYWEDFAQPLLETAEYPAE